MVDDGRTARSGRDDEIASIGPMLSWLRRRRFVDGESITLADGSDAQFAVLVEGVVVERYLDEDATTVLRGPGSVLGGLSTGRSGSAMTLTARGPVEVRLGRRSALEHLPTAERAAGPSGEQTTPTHNNQGEKT